MDKGYIEVDMKGKGISSITLTDDMLRIVLDTDGVEAIRVSEGLPAKRVRAIADPVREAPAPVVEKVQEPIKEELENSNPAPVHGLLPDHVPDDLFKRLSFRSTRRMSPLDVRMVFDYFRVGVYAEEFYDKMIAAKWCEPNDTPIKNQLAYTKRSAYERHVEHGGQEAKVKHPGGIHAWL